MKHLLLTLFAIAMISACGKDDGDVITLNYDSNNATAPTLPSGFYEFAVRFPTQLTRNVEGLAINEFSFYLYDVPSNIALTISPDVNGSPGDIAYSQGLNNLRSNGWNDVPLDVPYFMDGSPIWVGIQVDLTTTQQTIGCDAGPSNPNGDWLYDETDQEFRRFLDRVGDSVNWNIRIKVK